MVVQLPSEPEVEARPAEIEAGVIDDARARHRRERWGAAVVALIAVGLGLWFGLSGGGGGSAPGARNGGGGVPGGGGSQRSQPLAVITHTPPVEQFGLISPGVGWVANGADFYLTRNGGRSWAVLSHVTTPPRRHRSIRAFEAINADSENVTAVSSPSAGVLAIGFQSMFVPMTSVCQSGQHAIPLGAVAVSGDAGRTWDSNLLPDCDEVTSLSFLNANAGFAVFSGNTRSSSLYRTADSGEHWRRVSSFPAPMTVSFGNRSDGLASVTPNTRTAAAVIYRTTDGGRSWKHLGICGDTRDPTFTVYCDAPVSFGRSGVVLAVAQDLSKVRSDHAYLYTTADAGADWTRHAVPPLDSPEMPVFSAPNARDIFIYAINGVLHTSTDGGRSWHSMREPQFRTVEQMQFVNADYGWLVTPTAFDYTRDGGRSWSPVGSH